MRASHRNGAWAALALAGAFAGCDGNTNNGSEDFFAVTRRASLNSSEKEGNEVCSSPSISADGRFVAFASKSTNLHPDDTDLQSDIFVRDLQTGVTILASRATDGSKANGNCFNPKISADGRYVVFDSVATNLYTPDTNGVSDIFRRDLLLGTTELVSRDLPAWSNYHSVSPSISSDGRYVTFTFIDVSTGSSSVYLRDTQLMATESISFTATTGIQESSISTDGAIVAYTSLEGITPNQIRVLLMRDRVHAVTKVVSHVWGDPATASGGNSTHPSVSADGRFIAFASEGSNLLEPGLDANGVSDIFVYDVQTGGIVRVSNANAGTEAIGASYSPSISADGRYVAFVSLAANLVNGDTNKAADVFVRDTKGRTTVRVSVRTYGAEANDASDDPVLTADGSYVAFTSVATDLVEGDNNNTTDVFVRGPLH